MSGDMTRNPGAMSINVGLSLGNSDAIPFQDFAAGHIHVPSSEGASFTLTAYVADDDSDSPTYQAAYTYDGTQVTQTVGASKSYEFHPALSGALSVKLVASSLSADPTPFKITAKS